MSKLEKLLKERGSIKKIGVLGMGYVGIPAAVLFADAPCFDKVLGFQRNSKSSGYKIDMLNRGESPLKGEEPGLEDLIGKVVKAGKFEQGGVRLMFTIYTSDAYQQESLNAHLIFQESPNLMQLHLQFRHLLQIPKILNPISAPL